MCQQCCSNRILTVNVLVIPWLFSSRSAIDWTAYSEWVNEWTIPSTATVHYSRIGPTLVLFPLIFPGTILAYYLEYCKFRCTFCFFINRAQEGEAQFHAWLPFGKHTRLIHCSPSVCAWISAAEQKVPRGFFLNDRRGTALNASARQMFQYCAVVEAGFFSASISRLCHICLQNYIYPCCFLSHWLPPKSKHDSSSPILNSWQGVTFIKCCSLFPPNIPLATVAKQLHFLLHQSTALVSKLPLAYQKCCF